MDMTEQAPLEIASEDQLAAAAGELGAPPGMLRLLRRCPECLGLILVCDNGVWLDAEATHDSGPLVMSVMQMGSLSMAAGGGGYDPRGSRHHMHQHQPPER